MSDDKKVGEDYTWEKTGDEWEMVPTFMGLLKENRKLTEENEQLKELLNRMGVRVQ